MLSNTLYHIRREALSYLIETGLNLNAWRLSRRPLKPKTQKPRVANPTSPEDFHPLENQCFQSPFAFYKMIRDQQPVYQLANGIYCISRYDDIVKLSRDTETFSSTQQGAVAGLKKGQSIKKVGAIYARIGELGISPVDVLATSDQPFHTGERKIGHSALNSRFVKSLESKLEKLCSEMMDQFIDSGEIEFMQAFAWRLPMIFIIRLLGLPEKDFEKIKAWCVHGISSQSGISNASEMAKHQAEVMVFTRYCWRQYLKAKAHRIKLLNSKDTEHTEPNIMDLLIDSSLKDDNHFSDKHAVSTIFQLLIAGSDSSATSMGNALKMLIENRALQNELREDHSKIPAFIEEVFRMEAAFQGHFRWAKKPSSLHGKNLPEGSRIFLMWASGNRDERFWENPDEIILNRANGKKHLTFGHGIHACLGRELARMEIRLVLREFLTRTDNLKLSGEAPFIASMFARTLLTLPISFDKIENGDSLAA